MKTIAYLTTTVLIPVHCYHYQLQRTIWSCPHSSPPYLQKGSVHTDTSTSTVSRVQVIVNMSLHVFQQQPFAIIRVL